MTSVDMLGASMAASNALRGLDRREYIPAMGAVCVELGVRYGAVLTDPATVRLLSGTLDLARRLQQVGSVDEIEWRRVADSWNRVVDVAENDSSVDRGHLRALETFAAFAWELNSTADHYSAAGDASTAFEYLPTGLGGSFDVSPFEVFIVSAKRVRPAEDLNVRLLHGCVRCSEASSLVGGQIAIDELHRQVFAALH